MAGGEVLPAGRLAHRHRRAQHARASSRARPRTSSSSRGLASRTRRRASPTSARSAPGSRPIPRRGRRSRRRCPPFRRRATPPSRTTRSTRSAGPTPAGPCAMCATASSRRPASRRCRGGRQGARAATTSRRRSPHAPRAAFRMLAVIADEAIRWTTPRSRGRRNASGGAGPPRADRPRHRARAGRRLLVFDPTRVRTASSSRTTRSCASARGPTRRRWRAARAPPLRPGVRPLSRPVDPLTALLAFDFRER